VIERGGGKLLAWTFTLALVLAFLGLLAATSESLHRQEGSFPFTEAVEPDLSPHYVNVPDPNRDSGVAG
jgi:hypothetical protein